jgi:hypothetical protein
MVNTVIPSTIHNATEGIQVLVLRGGPRCNTSLGDHRPPTENGELLD